MENQTFHKTAGLLLSSFLLGLLSTAYLHVGNFKWQMFELLFQADLFIVIFFWLFISCCVYIFLSECIQRRPKDCRGWLILAVWFIVSILFIRYMCLNRSQKYYYDTNIFANQAAAIEENGLSFSIDYDRYFYHSFLLMIGLRLFYPFTFDYGACYTMMLSLLYCASAFLLTTRLFPARRPIHGLAGFIVFLGLTILFCKDLFIYPLSDASAISVSIICIFLLTEICRRINSKTGGSPDLLIYCFVCGSALYFLHGIRPVYLLIAPFFLAGFVFYCRRRLRGVILPLLLLVTGFFLAGIPLNYQKAYVEQKTMREVYSPFLTEQTGTAVGNFNTGLKYQIWMTYIGESDMFRSGKIFAGDPAGQLLVDRCGEMLTIRDAARCFSKYPLDMLGVFARHGLIMLFPISTKMEYVNSLDGDHQILIFAMFLIYFLVVSDIVLKFRCHIITREKLLSSPEFMLITPLLLIFVFSLTSVPVYRYALPVFYLNFFYFSVHCSWRELFQDIRRHFFLYALIFVTGLALVSNTISEMLSCIIQYPTLIQ